MVQLNIVSPESRNTCPFLKGGCDCLLKIALGPYHRKNGIDVSFSCSDPFTTGCPLKRVTNKILAPAKETAGMAK